MRRTKFEAFDISCDFGFPDAFARKRKAATTLFQRITTQSQTKRIILRSIEFIKAQIDTRSM